MKKNNATYWLYGRHACQSALLNPNREIRRVVATRNAAEELAMLMDRQHPEIVDTKTMNRYVPGDAVHQGMAMEVIPLAQQDIGDIADTGRMLIMLDQVSDPHNVGAILRSAAAFNAGAVIVHDRHAPKESGVMGKAASGALDTTPLISVHNIAHCLDELQSYGYWSVGLDGSASDSIGDISLADKTVFVMGAEGKGLRRLTAQRCDQLTKLPIHEDMESLNVSNAAAITMYVHASRT